jgi:hypothetical protein
MRIFLRKLTKSILLYSSIREKIKNAINTKNVFNDLNNNKITKKINEILASLPKNLTLLDANLA